MVYVLKMKLKDTAYPAERIVHVRKETSFRQLHHIIQAVYDWHGGAAHIFTSGRNGIEPRWIGNTSLKNERFMDGESIPVLDETSEQIRDWLNQPGDQLIYRYNPQQDWLHSVELLEIIEPDESILYPVCVEAFHDSPLETEPNGVLQEAHAPEELVTFVNESLKRSLSIINADEAKNQDAVWEQLLLLSRIYYEEMPWNHLSTEQVFVLVDPETGTTLFCSVSGKQEDVPGLNVYIGEESFSQVLESSALLEDTDDTLQAAFALNRIEALGLVYKTEEELDNEDLHLLEDHSVLFSNRQALPAFSSISPDHSVPMKLHTDEARWMILALEQTLEIIDLIKKGLEVPVLQEASVMLARVYSPEYDQFINSEMKVIRRH